MVAPPSNYPYITATFTVERRYWDQIKDLLDAHKRSGDRLIWHSTKGTFTVTAALPILTDIRESIDFLVEGPQT